MLDHYWLEGDETEREGGKETGKEGRKEGGKRSRRNESDERMS